MTVAVNLQALLLPAGALQVSVWQEAATLKVHLEGASQPASNIAAVSPEAAACQAAAAEGKVRSVVQVALWVPCLQISLWDDERGRLMGSRPDLAAAIPAAQEAFCLAVDDLALVIGQQRSGSGAGSVANWSVLLEARSLQLDSHLPSSSHPVVCRSVGSTGSGAAILRDGHLPLRLELEVGRLISQLHHLPSTAL